LSLNFKGIRGGRFLDLFGPPNALFSVEIGWCKAASGTGQDELQGYYPSYLLVLRRKALSGGIARHRSTSSRVFQLSIGPKGCDEHPGSIFWTGTNGNCRPTRI